MTRSTCLCTLLGCRNESWGPLSTFTTIEVCSETPCLKHPVAALGLNSYSLTNERSLSGSTDYALGVAHNTSHILRLFPRSLRLHIGMCSRRSSNGQRTLSFIRAIAGRKLHLQFLRAIPLFTFTHDSCVMSTICQSPRACRDDFQQLLPSRMD
jgi:hypothetical protein